MLANQSSRPDRQGIVLVLVLAMLGLLALIGVTFATFAGQSRINNRNYQQSLLQPQAEELLDFGMQQLISDTNDIRSVIRGHSLARDMYGTGSTSNGFLPLDPETGYPFYITSITSPASGNIYTVTIGSPVYDPSTGNTTLTNIASNDVAFYGYDFTRWIMRVSFQGTPPTGATGTVNQTFEVLYDSGFNSNSSSARTFNIQIGSTDGQLLYSHTNNQFYLTTPPALTIGTNLYNPTNGTTTDLPGQSLVAAATVTGSASLGTVYQFSLDGRWLHAFNGPGMGANAYAGNFRYNGLNPNSVGMDEDYDACDLENWFLALQSADGQVMIPSFHRPANIRNDTQVNALAKNPATVNDWIRLNPANTFASSASRILRPVAADGHDPATFPDLIPDNNTGQITYDVDNDGDGNTDSVWLDLGYPARPDASGRLYKPLFAFMVIGLNGRIPLNTAGNLAGTVAAVNGAASGAGHSLHLGNSSSEIDPMYALQNGYDPNNDMVYAFEPPYPANTNLPANSQTDNGGIDVRSDAAS